jgi:hypothetical protein
MLFVGAPKDLSPERIQRWLDDLPAGDIRDAYRAAFQDPVVVASMRALFALTSSSRRDGRAALKPCKRFGARPVINAPAMNAESFEFTR